MRAERAKQLLKNGVYRTIGETTATLSPRNGAADARLRVLMYHKVNDLPENPLSVPVGAFDEQLAQLRELGYTVVALDAVLAYYRDGTPLPARPVLITFDDGYRDNLEHAAPVLQKHGYPAVIFVPIGYLDGGRPLPHEEQRAARGLLNSDRRLGRAARARGRRRARRVARDQPPAARRARGRRGGARDRRSRSCGSRSGSAARCARSRTSRARRRTTRRCT